MDSKTVYETCGVVAEALPIEERRAFADMIERATLDRAPVRGRFHRLSDALPDTARPMLMPLWKTLRAAAPAPRAAARRWLRDAGWLA